MNNKYTTCNLIPAKCYRRGDCTRPVVPAEHPNAIIAHVCNDSGHWGAGFVLSISKRWISPELQYRQWHSTGSRSFGLGKVQLVSVEPHLWVANMVAQHGVGRRGMIHYDALRTCLTELADLARLARASVHMPRIGCGLGGGDWSTVERIIYDTLICKGIHVIIYDLKPSR